MTSNDSQLRGGYSGAFLVIAAAFVASLIVSNIISMKLIQLGPWAVPAGVIVFPISYMIGDVLTEVYGYRYTRQVIWLGFSCNLVVALAIAAAVALPAAPFWPHQAAYGQILGYAPRLLAASFAAYLIGEFTNAYVLARLKLLTDGRWLWLRTISSTVLGQALDSTVFMTIAFAGVIPTPALFAAAVTQWLVKSGYGAAVTPLTYWIVGMLKRRDGVDARDDSIDFNPFRLQR